MGWLSMQSLGGHRGPREYLDAQFTYENEDHRSKVLRSAVVRRTYYAAVETTHAKTAEREVWALVCLVKYNPRASDGFIFSYKSMEEMMGPYYFDCPAAVLDLLTPTTNAHALEWRKACREKAAAEKAKRARPKLRPGQIIIFEAPMQFSDGAMIERMEVVAHPLRKRALLFRDPGRPGLYRIPGVNSMTYRLEDGENSTP